MLFTNERQIIDNVKGEISQSLLILGTCGLLSFVAPLTGLVKGNLATFSLIGSIASFSALAYKASELDDNFSDIIENAQEEDLEMRLAIASTQHQLSLNADSRLQLAVQIAQKYFNVNPELGLLVAEKCQVSDFYSTVTGFRRVQPVEVIEAPQQALLKNITLPELQGSDQPLEEKYDKLQNSSVVFLGNPGEAKTNCAHYALYRWVKADPSLLVSVFDPHAGSGRKDPRFKSTWLGLPRLNKLENNIINQGVYRGEAHELLKFLNQILYLYQYRKKNEIDQSHNDYFPCCFVIDEFTNQLKEMEEDQANACRTILKAIATGAPKYGLFIWYVTHSLTKDETNIDRTVFRTSQLVIGCDIAQDSVQMSNAPKSISKQSIEMGARLLQNGLPCGYITTIPGVKDNFLPLAPMTNQDMILEWGKDTSDDRTIDVKVDSSDDINGDVWLTEEEINQRSKVNPVDRDLLTL